MQQQRLALPGLEIGESWTVQVRNESTRDLDITVFITTAGGSIISIPMRSSGDICITAGSDVGDTTFLVSLDGSPADRKLN